MRATVTIKGLTQLRTSLRRLASQSPAKIAGPFYRFAETQIAGPARATYVPVRFGVLRASIMVQPPIVENNRVVVVVGAGGAAAPYALAVHENPRAGKTGGLSPQGQPYKHYSRVGGWKYLETPALEAAKQSGGLIREIRVELERLARGGA